MSTAKVLFPNDEEIYRIMKGLPNTEKLQDKIWESFCLENEVIQNDKKTTQKRRRFKKHPTNFQKEQDDVDNAEDCSSMCSDDIAEALFGAGGLKKPNAKCQSAKCQSESEMHPLDDEYDSLDEFCDVTFRKIGSVLHKPLKLPLNVEDIKCPAAKKIMPSVVPSKPVKMMSPIKPKKVILKEAFKNPSIIESTTKLEMDTVSVLYDMNKDRRLKTVLQKCNNSMDDIRLLIDIGIPQPDGAEDYLRRKKRAVEFSNRFSRIYLYQLNRLINDIRKLLRPHTTQKALHASSVKMNLSSRTNITQKFIQTLQLVQQSLHAYYNHLPTSIIVGAPEKLKDLLNLCSTIGQLQHVVVSTPGAGGDEGDTDNVFAPFNTRSKSLLERINECCQIDSKTSILKSDRSKLSLLGYNISKGKGIGGVSSKMQLSVNSSRFSMYGGGGTGQGCRKDAYWRNAIAALGKKHFNVTSRYKTAKFKHRPDMTDHRLQSPQQQPAFQAYPINMKPTHNLSSASNIRQPNHIAPRRSDVSISIDNMAGGGGVRRTRRQRYSLNDDNVTTQMQNVGEDNAGGGDAVVEVGVAVDGEISGGEMVNRRRGKKHQKGDTNYHHHHSKPTLPHPPNSSIKRTPPPHPANEFMGDSSQCDMSPPHTKLIPPAPASTTTNTPKSSLCQLHHQSHTINNPAKPGNEFARDPGDGCPNCTGNNHPEDEEAVTFETCHQIVPRNKFEMLPVDNAQVAYEPCHECHECQRQSHRLGVLTVHQDGDGTTATNVREETRNEQKTIGSAADANWNRLSGDCDRTLRRLDERMVGGCCGGGGAKGWNGMEGEGGDGRGVKRDMAKKLAGLVKKSLMVEEGARGGGSGGDKRRDKVTVTSVTGAKNAKLICIRDDNSLILDTTPSDIAEESAPANAAQQRQPNRTITNRLHACAHSQTQTDVSTQGQRQFDSQAHEQPSMSASGQNKRKNVKISRLPKAKIRRQLQMLDKEMSLNVIRYKLEYHKARKENPMYKKAANGVQPWALMEKVSDGILDHLLLSVAREIQVDDILVKLYESEFYAA